MSNRPTPAPHGPLLPMRTALVLMLGFLTGTAVTTLLLLDGHSPAAVTLAGLGAFAAGIKFFHWLIL